jgi:hypothetical protein
MEEETWLNEGYDGEGKGGMLMLEEGQNHSLLSLSTRDMCSPTHIPLNVAGCWPATALCISAPSTSGPTLAALRPGAAKRSEKLEKGLPRSSRPSLRLAA